MTIRWTAYLTAVGIYSTIQAPKDLINVSKQDLVMYLDLRDLIGFLFKTLLSYTAALTLLCSPSFQTIAITIST